MIQNAHEYIELVKSLKKGFLEYPSTISIETKSLCNADCSFCPYSSLKRKGIELPDTAIEKIIREISQFPINQPLNIVLTRLNETFLDKRWPDICNHLLKAKENITFGFFTNGTPLTENNVRKLIALKNVQYLNVSLNYSDPDEHYENMKIKFDQVIKNLDRLHKLKEGGEFKPLVVISRVGTGDTRDNEFYQFVSYRYPLFRVKIAPKSNWAGNIEVDDTFSIPNIPCRQWFQLHILADGRQAYCCLDAEGEHITGNIHDTTILEMYNHPELVKLREELPCRLSIDVCKSCTLLP